MGNDKLPIV